MADFVLELEDGLSDSEAVQAVLDTSNSILNGDFIVDGEPVAHALEDDIVVRLPNGMITEGD